MNNVSQFEYGAQGSVERVIKAAADVVGVDVLHQVAPENETLKTDRKKNSEIFDAFCTFTKISD